MLLVAVGERGRAGVRASQEFINDGERESAREEPNIGDTLVKQL